MVARLILLTLALVSSTAFAYYGVMCMYSTRVRREYRRYGIPQLRILNGSLMLCGAGGVMVGLLLWPIGMLAAAGLCVMMLLGLLTRVRLGDHPRLMIPATTLASLNAVLVVLFAVT